MLLSWAVSVLNICLGQVPREAASEKQRGGGLLGSALRESHLGMWRGARWLSPARGSPVPGLRQLTVLSHHLSL